jgi:acyl-[acyl carrier protein]--UDP-N-acetylglucosamine O-acyltransferase
MGYELKKTIKVSELLSNFELSFEGEDLDLLGVTTIDRSLPGFVAFSKQNTHVPKGSVVVGSENCTLSQGCVLIKSTNPRLDFIRILSFLCNHIGFSTYDFESKIHPSVLLGTNVVVEKGCVLREGVVIEANTVIHSGTTVGANTRIRSCSSIGGDGFGFERLDNALPLRFPHLGGVIIGDNVEIGSCTAIARGTLSDTVIENNVKIDNLVHIAHNCLIKNGAFIIACAEVSGGVVIGENSWISPNSSINQKIVIGENSLVGLGSVVTKDVEPSCIYAGNPARKLRDI